ncbi:MAG: insulinase family protein [Fusobacterium sp.]|nr:insulinase family protein [Fusobacterium sp.]
MLRINSININPNNQIKYVTAPVFRGEPNEVKKTEDVQPQPAVTPDFNVKKPMAYNKIYEADLPFDLKAHYYKLANGQKVVIVPKEGATVLKTYVNTGSMNETDNIRGISHYLEHNFFNGSDGLEKGEFFKTVDKMGAYTNAATGMAETNYFIKSNLLKDTDFEEQMKIHASMLQSPKFALEMLEKEKDIVNSEINMITSDPVNIGLNKMIKNLYNIDTKSIDLIGGTTDNINNITREDVVNYYNQNYYPANMTTVITGDVKPEEAIELVSKYFTSEKQPSEQRYFENLKPIDKPVREDIISDKAKATTVIVGFNGPESDNIEDKVKMIALNMVLSNLGSSRLEDKLKDLNTSLFIDDEKISSKKGAPRTMIAAAQTTEENSEKVLKMFYQEVENIKVNPPTDEELEIAKKQMHKIFSSVFETSASTNSIIGEVLLDSSFDEITEFEKLVDGLTSKDLADTAKKYYDLNKASITVVHPKSADETKIKTNYDNAKKISFGAASKVFNEDDVKSFVLPNNMQVVTNNIKTNQANIVLDVMIPHNEEVSKKRGAGAILDYMLNQGTMTKNKNELAKELEKMGISGSFQGSLRGIGANMEFASEDSEKALDLMKEVLNNPRFTEEEFRHAKAFVIDALSISNKSANDKLLETLFPDEPAGMTKKEMLQAVEDATLEDVQGLYKDIISRAQASIVMSAPFEKKPELQNTLFTKMNDFPTFKKFSHTMRDNFKPLDKATVVTDHDARNQAKIIEAFTFKNSGNMKDELTIKLMTMILGDGSSSRLFNDLRETRKLAYSVRAGLDNIGNTGMIKLSIGTTTENVDTGEISYDNVQKAIAGFNENVERMVNEKVSDEELESVKLAMKNAMLNATEHHVGKSDLLSDSLDSYYGLTYSNQKFDLIDKITAEDIQNAAKYVFAGKPIYSILATQNTLDYNKEYFKTLEA